MCNFHKKRDTYSSFKRLAGEVCPVENNEKLPNDSSLRDRSFLMGDGWGAGGIRRVAPVVYDDPPPLFLRSFLGAPPPPTNVSLIYRDDPSPPPTPPPQRKKRKEKKRERESEQRK